VDRQVADIAGHLSIEAPENRKSIYPRRTPDGYPLADKLAARIEEATGWRDMDGKGKWTWHSLRHVFCTTALFVWKLDLGPRCPAAGARDQPNHTNWAIARSPRPARGWSP
jgi:hypothetical protein